MVNNLCDRFADQVVDRLGDFNPQLMRELKSRLSWRNVGVTALLLFLMQGMVLIGQYSKLPVSSCQKSLCQLSLKVALCI